MLGALQTGQGNDLRALGLMLGFVDVLVVDAFEAVIAAECQTIEAIGVHKRCWSGGKASTEFDAVATP
jgi:hypothetical protein